MSVFPQVLKNSFSLSCWFIHRWSRVTITSSRLRRVDWLPRVGHLCHEPVHVVRCVGGRLDPTVGQGDCEGALHVAAGILRLRLLEVGLAVVVGDPVLVGEGLGSQLLLNVGGGGVLGGGEGGGDGDDDDQLQHVLLLGFSLGNCAKEETSDALYSAAALRQNHMHTRCTAAQDANLDAPVGGNHCTTAANLVPALFSGKIQMNQERNDKS